MIRLFTKNATGIATDGRWYPGDINAIQDAVAALTDLAQNLSVGTLAVGEAGLQVVRYGAGEARLTGALRTDGVVRALGGFYAGAFTTTARDAIPAAQTPNQRPFGLVILNTTTNRFEWNSGTDAAPNWQPISGGGSVSRGTNASRPLATAVQNPTWWFLTDINGGTLTYSDGAVWTPVAPGLTQAPVIADASLTPAKTIGTAVVNADARLSDARTPTAHHASHERGGSDAVLISTWISSGTAAARPSTGLVAGMIYTKTDIAGGTTEMYNGASWVAMALGVTAAPVTSLVTTLPGSPTDGQEVILVDSTSNPTYNFRMRYNAGSSSAYKWECVGDGGGALEGTTTITIPRAGDWMVEIGASGFSTGPTSEVQLSVTAGGITLSAFAGSGGGGTQGIDSSPYDSGRMLALTASQVLTVANAGGRAPTKQYIRARPCRVS